MEIKAKEEKEAKGKSIEILLNHIVDPGQGEMCKRRERAPIGVKKGGS